MSDINSLNKNNTSYVISALNYIVICDTNANVVAKTASAPDAFNLDSNSANFSNSLFFSLSDADSILVFKSLIAFLKCYFIM